MFLRKINYEALARIPNHKEEGIWPIGYIPGDDVPISNNVRYESRAHHRCAQLERINDDR